MRFNDYEILEQYVRIKKKNDTECFCDRMLTRASVDGALELQIRHINTDAYYYFNTGQMKSLESISHIKALDEETVTTLMICIAGMMESLHEHLLDNSMLIMQPELIFYDTGRKVFNFCVYPENKTDIEKNYECLGEFLLNSVDNEDERAVDMVYKYYDLIEEGNYSPLPCINNDNDEMQSNIAETDDEESCFETIETSDKEENFYFSKPDKEETEKEQKAEDLRSLMLSLAICGLLIVMLGSGYVYLFLNTALLNILGIKQEQYIVFGAGMVIAAIVAIMCIFRAYSIKRQPSSGLKLC